MPCSPVHVPPIFKASSTIALLAAFPLATEFGSSMSSISSMWKFPSPTWPTSGANTPWRMTAACAPSTASARRLTGTHTSVGRPRSPGRVASDAQYAVWRACHRRARSSGSVAHWKPEPPTSDVSSFTSEACSLTPASVPWNSKKSVGAGWKSVLEYALTAEMARPSSSSMRATGTEQDMIACTLETALAMSGKHTTAAETASGCA
mmetsp:Transcript_32345/g.96572  ORF Transcript_32345/g.96572 Transcript_32345/m.96572 type:complete len:206 (-) Transcript_32345:151-768(-)